MIRRYLVPSIIAACLCITVLLAYATVGGEAPEFRAIDILSGKEIALSDFRGKIIVLEWTNPRCPYVAKQYSAATHDGVGNIQSMQKRYTQPSVGVVWITIASSPKDSAGWMSADEWKVRLQRWEASPTALIIDESGAIAELYGAQRTPEVCVIGKDGRLLYRGAVDSIRGTDPGEIDQFNNLHWLRQALEQSVKGRRVVPPETIPYGTPIR